MGEASRRGTLKDRKASPKGTKKRGPKAWLGRLLGTDEAVRQESKVAKRERTKLKRATKRKYRLTRAEQGAIGAGHMPFPWERAQRDA